MSPGQAPDGGVKHCRGEKCSVQDPVVVGLNPGQVELGVRSPFVKVTLVSRLRFFWLILGGFTPRYFNAGFSTDKSKLAQLFHQTPISGRYFFYKKEEKLGISLINEYMFLGIYISTYNTPSSVDSQTVTNDFTHLIRVMALIWSYV